MRREERDERLHPLAMVRGINKGNVKNHLSRFKAPQGLADIEKPYVKVLVPTQRSKLLTASPQKFHGVKGTGSAFPGLKSDAPRPGKDVQEGLPL